MVEIELGLRNDVYRRPLATALNRLGLAPGWKCADIGAGGGDVSIALASIVGAEGRIYAVDSDPASRDHFAEIASKHAQGLAITQAGEDLALPEGVDLAFCRFLLMHVIDPLAVLVRMAKAVRPGGWIVAQEPITSSGRVDGIPFSFDGAKHPDVGAVLPAYFGRDLAGITLVDCWAEAPAGFGEGPVRDYLAELTESDPGDVPIILPPLVTVVAQKAN